MECPCKSTMERSHLSTKSRSRGSAPPLAQQSSRALATVDASRYDDGGTGLRWDLPLETDVLPGGIGRPSWRCVAGACIEKLLVLVGDT